MIDNHNLNSANFIVKDLILRIHMEQVVRFQVQLQHSTHVEKL